MERLLPKVVSNDYRGPRVAVWFLAFMAAVSIVRSCIHIFAPDGGAHSIAGIDISLAGGATIVGMFAQWGSEQLLLAILQTIVVLRYRVLVPLMYVFMFLEYTFRECIGLWKPLGTHHAPGVTADYIIIPLSAIMVFVSLRRTR